MRRNITRAVVLAEKSVERRCRVGLTLYGSDRILGLSRKAASDSILLSPEALSQET